MVREYGNKPYSVALVHGGPGACGSLAHAAKALSSWFGVIEPIQSKYSVPKLIEELREQIQSATDQPIALAGHSWGAWLVVLFAEKYPELVKRLILIDSGPFEPQYVQQIAQRRLANLSAADAERMGQLFAQLESADGGAGDAEMSELGALVGKADNFDPMEPEPDADGFPADSRMYAAIWNEAAQMREDGRLLAALRAIRCPVTVLHGDHDPHPVDGVVEPLIAQGVACEVHVLKNCGHSPFEERQAADQFYQLMVDAITGA